MADLSRLAPFQRGRKPELTRGNVDLC